MQFSQPIGRTQLPLFHDAIVTTPLHDLLAPEAPLEAENEAFSELSLRGSTLHCRHLLAPILRELSEEQDARWLTLIGAPTSLNQAWLRDAGLNRERILLLEPRGGKDALELACEALRLGRSHTVISWLSLTPRDKDALVRAAQEGNAQSLNIHLG